MPWPDFIVIGAARSGTTSLYHYLRQHPQVFLCPVSEPNYFALDADTLRDYFRGPRDRRIVEDFSVRDEGAYQALFTEAGARIAARERIAVGEASPLYLYSPVAPGRIRDRIPGVRLIAMLRDPVQRAFSNYVNYVQTGLESLPTFAQALQAEPERMRLRWGPYPFWYYRQFGYYHRQLSRYLEQFSPAQIRLYLYEDFTADPAAVLQDLYGFLGVDAAFAADVRQTHNRSGLPRSRLVHRLLTRPNVLRQLLKQTLPAPWRQQIRAGLARRNTRRPVLDAELAAQLRREFREDVLRLQELLQRDLSGWL